MNFKSKNKREIGVGRFRPFQGQGENFSSRLEGPFGRDGRFCPLTGKAFRNREPEGRPMIRHEMDRSGESFLRFIPSERFQIDCSLRKMSVAGEKFRNPRFPMNGEKPDRPGGDRH